ncbi:MAG: ATP-binding protein [Dehalococcoidia bacterium]
MPIRWRLTLWFSLILSVILILSGVFLHTFLERHLKSEIDDNLKMHSALVHGTLHSGENPEPLDYNVIHSSLPPINEFASPGIYIQVIDSDGNVVVKSDNLGAQELPVDPELVERGFSGTVDIATVSAGKGTHVRIMVSPLFLQNKTLLLEVSQSLKQVDATMSYVRWALILSVLAALALSGISGVILARRALSPVEKITRTAKTIEESADLTRRVGYSGPMDEIGKLATTFDHMIEHLDLVFKSQDEFVSNASHDLRSPLTVLKGNLDLLKLNLGEEERKESLEAMRRTVDRMTSIVNDLLLLAEVDSGHVEEQEIVSLKGLLQDALKHGQQLAKNHRVAIGREEDLSVKGNAYRLGQMLTNLVDNAIRYTPDGGTITLSAYRKDEWACLEVTDTGIGIAPEHLPHLFDRFYRVDRARAKSTGGTGLGLAIVKGIAERYAGKVTVSSEPGKGSTFTVWFKL